MSPQPRVVLPDEAVKLLLEGKELRIRLRVGSEDQILTLCILNPKRWEDVSLGRMMDDLMGKSRRR